MNWGHKITIVIILFILLMLGMVFVAFNQTNEMVDENYYDKEIKYQTLIDAAENLNKVSSLKLIDQNKNEITLKLPISLIHEFKNGKLEFLKNDREKDDRSFNFIPDSEGIFKINAQKIPSGSYKVRISWMSQGKNYYREQNLYVR
jgi:hypothetical protein